MGLHTGTIKGRRRAPYRDQVLLHMLDMQFGPEYGQPLTDTEEAKITRVERFLPAKDCAREIQNARGNGK